MTDGEEFSLKSFVNGLLSAFHTDQVFARTTVHGPDEFVLEVVVPQLYHQHKDDIRDQIFGIFAAFRVTPQRGQIWFVEEDVVDGNTVLRFQIEQPFSKPGKENPNPGLRVMLDSLPSVTEEFVDALHA